MDKIKKRCIINLCAFVNVNKKGYERKRMLKKENKGIAKAFIMILQIGLTMLAPLLVCGWIGLWLDEKLDTTLGFLIMMLLGVLAAFRNFFQLVRGFYEKDLKRENAKQEYFDNLKRQGEKKQDRQKK